MRKSGSELVVGDVIEVWWAPHRDTIVGLTVATSKETLAIFPHGASFAAFAQCRSGMTIDHEDIYEVVAEGRG